MGIANLEILLDHGFSLGGIDLLLSPKDLYLVILTEDVKEGFILKLPGCEPGEIKIGEHGNVIEDWFVIDQP